MLVDANLLIYAHHSGSPHHERSKEWLEGVLNGDVRIGLPWQSLLAFARIATSASLFTHPLSGAQAWAQVQQWLRAPRAWVPQPTDRYGTILGRLIEDGDIRGPLVTDAALAALSIDHGVALASSDSDFARFHGIRWVNPLTG